MKKLIFLFLIISTTSYSQVSSNGLIACYKFSDTTDSYASNHGYLEGNATTNGVLNIGPNDIDVFFAPGAILNLSEFTVSFFVVFDAFNTNHMSASNTIFTGASASNHNLLNLSYVKSQLSGGASTLSNVFAYLQDNQRYEFNNINLVTDSLYHVTMVRSLTNLKLYINGVAQNPTGGINITPITSTIETNGLTFGQDQDYLAGGFEAFQSLNGSLDNFLVYDRDLTASEVLSIYKEKTCGRYTAIDEINIDQNFAIYPNPSDNILNIFYEEYSDYKIGIYSLDGRLIKQLGSNNQNTVNVDISMFSKGTYVVNLRNNSTGKLYQKKFIKL